MDPKPIKPTAIRQYSSWKIRCLLPNSSSSRWALLLSCCRSCCRPSLDMTRVGWSQKLNERRLATSGTWEGLERRTVPDWFLKVKVTPAFMVNFLNMLLPVSMCSKRLARTASQRKTTGSWPAKDQAQLQLTTAMGGRSLWCLGAKRIWENGWLAMYQSMNLAQKHLSFLCKCRAPVVS